MADLPPVLLPERFQELFDDFGDEASDVINEFVAETEGEIATLRTLLGTDAPDTDEVQRVAHKLKGGCMLIGAKRLQDVAVELDALGKQGVGGDAMTVLAPRLEAAWRDTLAALAPHR